MNNHLIRTLFFTGLIFLLTNKGLTEEAITTMPEENNLVTDSAEERDKLLETALSNPQQFKDELREHCGKYHEVLLIVAEAIQFGSRIFNAGKHGATFLHYQGSAYKVLYHLDGNCPELEAVLLASLARAEKEESYGSKAWRLREGLDLVMGPSTKPPGAR